MLEIDSTGGEIYQRGKIKKTVREDGPDPRAPAGGAMMMLDHKTPSWHFQRGK
ncbi:hypothetical protein [Bifidobacterium goeldii]|uniref:hypothetical protein n=1 Tax=Bifidobacterium goeldii TaxID=2306975 RepID=UPI0013DDB635|nr:hypothetical protein [Bifidobacterium goeldii]